VAPHHLGGRHGGQIGRPLMLAARAEGLAEREQDDDARHQRGQDAEHQQRRLTVLAFQTHDQIPARHHGAAKSR
jgi:hypothetical protein